MKRKTVVIGETLVYIAIVFWLVWPSKSLTDELIAKVTPGMTLDAAKALLGEPIQWERYREVIHGASIGIGGMRVNSRYRPLQFGLPNIDLWVFYPAPFRTETSTFSLDWLGKTRILHVTFSNDGKVLHHELRSATIQDPLWSWIENTYQDWTRP